MRNFSQEFQDILKRVNDTKELKVPETVNYQVFSVFKRSNKGYNKRVLIRTTKREASFWSDILNVRERVKRNEFLTLPEEIFFFDIVLEGSQEESPYYNPRPVVMPV